MLLNYRRKNYNLDENYGLAESLDHFMTNKELEKKKMLLLVHSVELK